MKTRNSLYNKVMASLGSIETISSSLNKLAGALSNEDPSGEEFAGAGSDGGEPDGDFSPDIEPGSEGEY